MEQVFGNRKDLKVNHLKPLSVLKEVFTFNNICYMLEAILKE